jgi:predicted DCC family thiol-disulfide oxidoreductase YuxK/uncharacterized membrane protein YphA (DoxX/SURF4 family)
MKTSIQRLRDYWFEPITASRLAIVRIASGLFSLWYLLSRFDMLSKLPANSKSMFEPVGLMTFFSEPFSEPVFQWLLLSTIAFNIIFIIGFKFRYTAPMFALLLLVFFSYRNSFSMIYHNYNLLVLHVLVMAFAASADAFSLDALLHKNSTTPAASSWKYGWPIKLICLVTVLAYFVSGMAKVAGDLAFQWITGEAMRSQVAVDSLRKDLLGESSSPLFYMLYPHTWIFLITGLLTMVVELGAPFFLFKKRLVYIWLILAFLMHWGVFFIMKITFYHQMTGIAFLSFLEPEKWWDYLRNKISKPQASSSTVSLENKPSVVLFDGVCTFCDSTVQFIINRDSKGLFHFASLQSEKGKELLEYHQLPRDLSTIILIQNNKTYIKSSAILHILRYLDGGWKLLYVFIVVPVFIRDMVYKFVAKNRYRWFGQKQFCELPSIEIRQRFYN